MKFPDIPAIAAAIALAALTALAPQQALADWPASAFDARNVSDAISNLFGSADNTPSGKIKIDAPDSVKNGASVRVTVTTAMQVSAIAIVVEKNGQPLAANFELSDSAKGFVEIGIVVCETSDVIIVVKSGGKLFTGRRNVKVAGGGCDMGGGGKVKSKKTIRARASQRGGAVNVEATVNYSMGAQHITEVTATHKEKNKLVMTAQLGPFVSAKPRLAFKFAGAAKGDRVELAWVDNQGRSDSTEAKVK